MPASARGLAGRVLGHYQQIVRPAPLPALPPSPRRLWAWLAVLAALAAASGYGLYLAGPLAPYILMIGAAVLAVFALFGFAVWLLARGA